MLHGRVAPNPIVATTNSHDPRLNWNCRSRLVVDIRPVTPPAVSVPSYDERRDANCHRGAKRVIRVNASLEEMAAPEAAAQWGVRGYAAGAQAKGQSTALP